jgi:sugar lactone lactonase YvrE
MNSRAASNPTAVVRKLAGDMTFTDPDDGLRSQPSEIGGNWVFRFDPKTKILRVLAKDFDKPNGIALSPDGHVIDEDRFLRHWIAQGKHGGAQHQVYYDPESGRWFKRLYPTPPDDPPPVDFH